MCQMDKREGFQQIGSSARVATVVESEDDKLSASHHGSNRISDQRSSLSSSDIRNIEFLSFRFKYLMVICVIMLADGLQGTHLYVLYEGYGYSVASLYCLGFLTGAVTAPITGPLVDKFGRKRSALLYCALEMFINMLEQYPFLSGLIVSRMVGGITTNLLSSVFEAWFDTEFRNRNFDESKYETIMRDSVIVSNFAAIASGYLAHILAENLGPVGPFEGAVTCTGFALFVIAFAWSENYGTLHQSKTEEKSHRVMDYLADATKLFKHDSKLLRIGIIQGLSVGSLHIFIFLWSPTLIDLAKQVSAGTFGTDKEGLPAFGLIFGYFMIAGVIGGILSPFVRKAVSKMIGRTALDENTRPAGIELMAGSCYIILGFLLLVPCLVSVEDSESFTIALISFIIYELVGGICIPCEGVLRSYYIPSSSRATMMTLPRMVVNIAVAVGVLSTTQMHTRSAFGGIAFLMAVAACLQLSLVPSFEWTALRKNAKKMCIDGSNSFFSASIAHRRPNRSSWSSLPDLRSSIVSTSGDISEVTNDFRGWILKSNGTSKEKFE